MRRLIIAVSVVLAAAAHAQEIKDFGRERLNGSPRHADWVDIKPDLKAFVVYPERKDKAPVVIVVSEIFGLTDWVRSVCDELAENGVIGIAPDLHHGQKSEDLDAARKATSSLKKEAVRADLNATADYALTKIPAANGKLAVCGFCWGGGWAFTYAGMNPKLAAAYSFYGTTADDPALVKNIACPVYGFYGEMDERVNATIPKGEELMKAAGKKYEPVIYKGAGHGFMRDGESPQSNDPHHDANVKARDDAFSCWKTLLKQLG